MREQIIFRDKTGKELLTIKSGFLKRVGHLVPQVNAEISIQDKLYVVDNLSYRLNNGCWSCCVFVE